MALIIAATSLAAINVNAQSPDPSHVKIMRTPEVGVIKLLYANETNEPVTVTFSNASGEVQTDRIKGTYAKGFLKRYDVRAIYDKDFRIEISNSHLTVVYHIIPEKNNNNFVAHLEKTIYTDDVIASK